MAAAEPTTTPAIHAWFEAGGELGKDVFVDADGEGETGVLELADVDVDEVTAEDEDWDGVWDEEVLDDTVEEVSVAAACILLTTEAAIVASPFLACWPWLLSQQVVLGPVSSRGQ